jgi:hypothetical protein
MLAIRRAAVLIGTVTLAVPFTAANPATAAIPTHVQLTSIQYDSPGPDKGSNGSLNAERVVITNNTASTRSLNGWTLRDGQGHKYRFHQFHLAVGTSVTVHTGVGRNSSKDRYWNRTTYVWNNTAGQAMLVGPVGHVWDTCTWATGGTGRTPC